MTTDPTTRRLERRADALEAELDRRSKLTASDRQALSLGYPAAPPKDEDASARQGAELLGGDDNE